MGKVFIPGLPVPSLTMSSAMPRPSTPLDSVSTPKPLSKLLGSLDEVRNPFGVVKMNSVLKNFGQISFFCFKNDRIGSLAHACRI